MPTSWHVMEGQERNRIAAMGGTGRCRSMHAPTRLHPRSSVMSSLNTRAISAPCRLRHQRRAGGAHLPLDQGGVAGSVVRCGARDRAVVTGVAGDGREAAACSGYDVRVGVLPPFHMLSDSAGLMSWHVVRLARFVDIP